MTKKKVIKKRTVKQLEKELKILQESYNKLLESEIAIRTHNRELSAKLQMRVDDRQLEQRNRLASSLGQMIEATSKAVMYIIGKEVL